MKCAANSSKLSTDGSGFVQFVFDNADMIMSTIDGLNTFHALGGIKCITPQSSVGLTCPIIRQTDVLLDKDNNSIPIHDYVQPDTSALSKIAVKKIILNENDLQYAKSGFKHDILWLAGFINQSKTPSWNGYMKKSAFQTGK